MKFIAPLAYVRTLYKTHADIFSSEAEFILLFV